MPVFCDKCEVVIPDKEITRIDGNDYCLSCSPENKEWECLEIKNFDSKMACHLIWEALEKLHNLPSDKRLSEKQWDDVCTAMAWIVDDLGYDSRDF